MQEALCTLRLKEYALGLGKKTREASTPPDVPGAPEATYPEDAHSAGGEDVFTDRSEGCGKATDDIRVVVCEDRTLLEFSRDYIDDQCSPTIHHESSKLRIGSISAEMFTLFMRYAATPADLPPRTTVKDLLAIACVCDCVVAPVLGARAISLLREALQDEAVMRLRGLNYVLSHCKPRAQKGTADMEYDIRTIATQAAHWVLVKIARKYEDYNGLLDMANMTRKNKQYALSAMKKLDAKYKKKPKGSKGAKKSKEHPCKGNVWEMENDYGPSSTRSDKTAPINDVIFISDFTEPECYGY